MNDQSPKEAALRRINDEHAAWNALVAEVGEERMNEPGPMGEWTFKDLTSHLTGWRDYSISRFEAVLRGESDAPFPWPPVLTTDDEINSWIHDTYKDKPLAEVLSDHNATWDRLRTVIQEMPEELLTDPDGFPWMEGEAVGETLASGLFFGHLHEEHEPAVREWLDQSTAG
jgi:hypothetical protein